MAHTLLGFQRKAIAHLTELQNSVIASDDVKFGRDMDAGFRFFKTENAASRAIRMTCQIVGPNGDEKNGLRGKWLADCLRRCVRSLIGDFQDNRCAYLVQYI